MDHGQKNKTCVKSQIMFCFCNQMKREAEQHIGKKQKQRTKENVKGTNIQKK